MGREHNSRTVIPSLFYLRNFQSQKKLYCFMSKIYDRTPLLNTLFHIHRRYTRSINLERDLGKPDAVEGYVLTEQSLGTVDRILPHFIHPNSHRAWTLTGIYGTGKSAFVHFLTSLCFPKTYPVRTRALQILRQHLSEDHILWDEIEKLPNSGLVPAVITAQQEPLTLTIVRALTQGIEIFLGQKSNYYNLRSQLCDWELDLNRGENTVKPQDILKALKDLVQDVKAPILLVIDELGKNLEYAAQNPGNGDLYLLQQIAELSLKGKHQVYFIGLLHQSFAGYSDRLSVTEQNEWNKIQGRFEDITFSESPSQMLRLMAQVIDRSSIPSSTLQDIKTIAKDWHHILQPYGVVDYLSVDLLSQIYPLHPLTALILPLLCQRYAQNDRSLFTFLTSDESHGFRSFLSTHRLEPDHYPSLPMDQLYDYFIEAVTGLASRLNFQRWVEVKALIEDAQHQPPEVLRILKTIGVLNLISTTGNFRASPDLVAWALCDRPDVQLQKKWLKQIKTLQQKTLVTYRKAQNELRLWQGSDFDIEAAITEAMETDRLPLSQTLTHLYPLKPVVAQRHYTQTGNLRCFEQQYGDSAIQWHRLTCSDSSFDGLIFYWLDVEPIVNPSAHTAEGKPLIVIQIKQLDLLKTRSRELRSLTHILAEAKELQTDKVALREVRYRLVETERLLNETIALTLRWSNSKNLCWITGTSVNITTDRVFQNYLSNLCDRIYFCSLVLDNELINRRELTSQGVKARRELITAMLEQGTEPRLGLEGYGPEVSIYASVLQATGIHRQEEEGWGFYEPPEDSGAFTVWQAIVNFCFSATEKQRSIHDLYQHLQQPPYGVKSGTIPIFLAAILLCYADQISIYKEGTFIPVLGSEHFELLVKDPSRFSIKHIEVAGVRSQVFKELEAVLCQSQAQRKQPLGSRNITILSVVKPLLNFALALPKYTRNTQRLSEQSRQVLKALLQTQEPDQLIFHTLPQACGLESIGVQGEADETLAKTLRVRLVESLREIHSAYDNLLTDCRKLLYSAFGLRGDVDQLREDLRYRSEQLLTSFLESSLQRFARAALERKASDRQWLEAVVMVIADKPAESWKDEDVIRFELTLSDLSRRFKNVEALRAEVRSDQAIGFESRRITVTRPDGSEVHQMVWLDPAQQQQVDPIVDKLLEGCPQKLQQALLTRLTERIFVEGD